jgi:hypothetical protein
VARALETQKQRERGDVLGRADSGKHVGLAPLIRSTWAPLFRTPARWQF